MKSSKTKRLTLTALVAAIIFVVTFAVKIPIGTAGGYLNLGDAAVYIGAFLLGGYGGGAAAAVGSALSDITAGYFVYAPATFIIKGIMGMVCGILSRSGKFASFSAATLLSGLIMVAGYFLFETFVFNMKQAIASLPFNAVQYVGCIVAAMALFPAAKRIDRSYGSVD